MFPRNPIYLALNEATGAADGGAGAPPAPAAAVVAPEPVLGKEAPAAAAAPGAAAAVEAAAGDKAGETKAGEAAAAAAAELKPADHKAYLMEKAGNDQTKKAQVEAMSEADLKKNFDAAKAAEVAAAKPLNADELSKSLKLPQGFQLNKEQFANFVGMLKPGTTVEQVQAYIEGYARNAVEVAQAPYKLWADTQAQWQKDLQNDKEIGGDKLEANIAIGEKFLATLPNAKEVRAALKFTGAGNNPHIVKAFIAAGRLVTEGKSVTGQPGGGNKKSAAQTLYPSMASGDAASG